jgi:hypothetical protein
MFFPRRSKQIHYLLHSSTPRERAISHTCATRTCKATPESLQIFACCTGRRTRVQLHRLPSCINLSLDGLGFTSTTLCATTTRRPDCTGSTAPMSCIRTRRLAAWLLVGRPHWLSPCVRPLRLAARLLVVRIALVLLRLCRASGRAVSLLDFSSVGRTGSRRASGHCVSRHD